MWDERKTSWKEVAPCCAWLETATNNGLMRIILMCWEAAQKDPYCLASRCGPLLCICYTSFFSISQHTNCTSGKSECHLSHFINQGCGSTPKPKKQGGSVLWSFWFLPQLPVIARILLCLTVVLRMVAAVVTCIIQLYAPQEVQTLHLYLPSRIT